MKRDEAEQVWATIAALYDLHPERSGTQAVVWIPALEEMDASDVMGVVSRWMKGGGPDKMPSLPGFAAEVRALRGGWSHEHVDRCATCGGDGLVTIGQDVVKVAGGKLFRGADIAAPCPGCERGKRIEHPLERVGPWGPDGFWRGQSWTVVHTGVVEVGP